MTTFATTGATDMAAAYGPKSDYLTDPVAWLTDRLKEHSWSKQREVAESVRDNKYTAVPSGHGMGKSYLGGRIGCWFIDTRTPGEAFFISTAPSAAQVSAVLWRELDKAHRKGKLAGRITTAGYPMWKLHDGPSGLTGYGRKPSDYTDSAFQGIHAPEGVLIIVDEANGVSRNLFEQIMTVASTMDCRVLLLGNPTDPASYFAEACRPGSVYNVVRIDVLRSPNFTEDRVKRYPLVDALFRAEDIPYSTEVVPDSFPRNALSDAGWVDECLRNWCGLSPDLAETLHPDELERVVKDAALSSPIFTARVRAMFPDVTSEGVIPLSWVEYAMDRWDDWNTGRHGKDGRILVQPRTQPPGRRVIGVDVARSIMAGDRSVVAVRQGNVLARMSEFRTDDTMAIVDAVLPELNSPHAIVVVDTVGVGAGVFDRLKRLKRISSHVATVVPFTASAQSGRTDITGKYRFRNDRCAAWWNMREMLDPSRGSQICLPRDEQLLVELTSPRWSMLDASATIVVESKDDLRKRLKRSPDKADAVIQAFWTSGSPVSTWDDADGSVAYGGRLAEGAVAYSIDNASDFGLGR